MLNKGSGGWGNAATRMKLSTAKRYGQIVNRNKKI
jgi:hypothetical protein